MSKYDYLVKQYKDFRYDNAGAKEINDKFQEYVEKITQDTLELKDYTGRGGDYLCTFIERKSSKLYGSASAGSAKYFGIKQNDDKTYYISKKVVEAKEEDKKKGSGLNLNFHA